MSYPTAKKYFYAGIQQDFAEIRRIHFEIMTAKKVFEQTLPVGKIDGAYDKVYVKMFMPEFPLRLFTPYTGITEIEYNVFTEKIHSLLPEWLK